MIRKTDIKIKLSGNQLEALCMAYRAGVNQFKPENDHERLLREHALVMRERLEVMVNRGQLKYMLALNSVEAMAFYQLWELKFGLSTYEGNAVRTVYGVLHQQHSSLKIIGKAV